MKTFGVVMLFIILLLFGGTVFVIMNRPANLMIRKTFTALTGLEVVNAKAYDKMKTDNVLLEQQQNDRQLIIDSLIITNDSIYEQLNLKELRNASLQARVFFLDKELASAKELFDGMNITDQMIEFDLLTTGSKPTFLSDYQGHEVAITEPSRISDAAWKIHEGSVYRETVHVQAERIEVITDQLSMIKSVNVNLNTAIEHERDQRKDEVKKRENCEKAQTDTLKKAKGIAGGGALAIIIAIAILIL